jgi:hypothetical protein
MKIDGHFLLDMLKTEKLAASDKEKKFHHIIKKEKKIK